MDFILLKQVVDELAVLLPGAKVSKVAQSSDKALALSLHLQRERAVLLLAPDPSLPRIHLATRKPEGVERPEGFFLQLRKHLAGARIESAALPGDDRVVEMTMTRDGVLYHLYFELFGSRPNIVLTDGSGAIIAVLAPRPPDDRGLRALLPGMRYELPPARAGRGPGAGNRAATVPAVTGPPAVNEAAELLFTKVIEERTAAAERSELAKALRRARLRAERRIEAVSGDLAEASQAERYKLLGELVLANLGCIRTGMERVELAGPDGAPVVVPLDPVKGPAQNAEALFRRYKKAKAALAVVQERLDDAREEAEVIGLAQEELAQAPDRGRIAALRAKLTKLGLYSGPVALRREAPRSAASPYHTFMVEGWEVLVGASAAGNDYLTTKVARPDDFWLHAEGMPGSHVVVRNPGKRDVPPGVLKRAASLAAWHSKGRGSTKVAVAFTTAKFVRKPRGAPAGTVVLAERRTVMAVPEPYH